MFKRQIMAFILALSMIFTTATAFSNLSFAGEEPSDWAKKAVESALKKGYVPPRLKGHYRKQLNRTELAQLVGAYIEYALGDSLDEIVLRSRLDRAKKGIFSDTDDRAVEVITTLGIMYAEYDPKYDRFEQLEEKGKFGGNEMVTRSEAIITMYALLEALGIADSGDLNTDEKIMEKFTDWEYPSFNYMFAPIFNHGIVSSAGNKLNIYDKVTSEQFIFMLEKIDNSKMRNGYHSYLNTYCPRIGVIDPNYLNPLPMGIQFLYMDKGPAYLFSLGKGNDGWHKLMSLRLPGKEEDITLDNRDLYLDAKGEAKWAFEVGLELGDAVSDEKGNIHVAFVLRTAMFNEKLDLNKVPMLIIRKYAPDGKVLGTNQIFAKDFSGLKNLGRIANDGSFEMEIRNGKYEIAAIAEDINRTERRAVAVTASGNSAKARYLLANPKAMVREQDMLYSKKFGGYVYATLANEGEQRGFNIITSDGTAYNTFHVWQKPNFRLNTSSDFYEEFPAELGGLVETSKGLLLVGAANRGFGPEIYTGNRDIFVQVMTKTATPNASHFLGGEVRTGISNLPAEKKVTDYGVIWLTKLGKDELALDPKVVSYGDKVVVLWNVRKTEIRDQVFDFTEKSKFLPYFAILRADGTILQAPGRLPEFMVLGQSDMPVFFKNQLYWIAGGFKGLRYQKFNPMK
ncbi:MAG: hypothetical protein Q4A41_03465 [Bacillota bacterium]|nr:hypothetical protein [Bacillota bacterium]